eukprot:TRINITY_DN4554_c1_g3_i1.p1 TRINITY_DN4554_c1_g3~~TRINITY_DN4554_c1_g3_i1.p1  ORF type:complete len:308 (+),score=-12.63 TRINITY_DN4554_c1_g3_i1:127-924(+)
MIQPLQLHPTSSFLCCVDKRLQRTRPASQRRGHKHPGFIVGQSAGAHIIQLLENNIMYLLDRATQDTREKTQPSHKPPKRGRFRPLASNNTRERRHNVTPSNAPSILSNVPQPPRDVGHVAVQRTRTISPYLPTTSTRRDRPGDTYGFRHQQWRPSTSFTSKQAGDTGHRQKKQAEQQLGPRQRYRYKSVARPNIVLCMHFSSSVRSSSQIHSKLSMTKRHIVVVVRQHTDLTDYTKQVKENTQTVAECHVLEAKHVSLATVQDS